ncbi:multicopper oxidase family protein [Nonomuraea sp. NPDC049784]|uniref:multicopper oxidase family protein n=1 Tax=Nonomuraea sp. NPDC049784 TaxID=3154361 RepID=UPI00340E5445
MEVLLVIGYATSAAFLAAYCLAKLRWSLPIAAAAALLRTGSVGFLWAFDWNAAADQITLVLPAMLAAILLAPPRIIVARWRRRTAVLAAILQFYATFVAQAPPYLFTLEMMALVLLSGSALLRWLDGRPRVVLAIFALCALLGTVGAWATSRLPARAGMANHDNVDLGGQPSTHTAMAMGPHASASDVDISTLTGPRTGKPDRTFTLTAQRTTIRLASGQQVEAWTYNGRIPGPELRVKQGELVEVTLVNKDVSAGVTLHWHGLDVPNAEDGVAGLTQDTVRPGQSHVYRFVARQVGTFWYHSHQASDTQVRRGLLGALVVEPAAPSQAAKSVEYFTAFVHAYPTGSDRTTALSLAGAVPSSGVSRRAVKPGTPVRLRLLNADNEWRGYAITGAPFKVAAIDGMDLNGPTDISGKGLKVAGGGRYDLTFTMPNGPVQLAVSEDENGVDNPIALLTPDGAGQPAPVTRSPYLDPLGYGAPGIAPFGPNSRFDRQFTLLLGQGFGFFDGGFLLKRTINGAIFPNVPSLVVRKDDLVKVTFVNRSFSEHPMHLHGHHMLVLSRDGRPSTGSPWWTDTLQVSPGGRYEVAFRADNPGLWMDHCHNLEHASQGMSMHLMYEGYRTPYQVGSATGNNPE